MLIHDTSDTRAFSKTPLHYNDAFLRAIKTLTGLLPPVGDTPVGSSSPLGIKNVTEKGLRRSDFECTLHDPIEGCHGTFRK